MARLKGNKALERLATPFLKRPPGQPAAGGCVGRTNWPTGRRVGTGRAGWCWWSARTSRRISSSILSSCSRTSRRRRGKEWRSWSTTGGVGRQGRTSASGSRRSGCRSPRTRGRTGYRDRTVRGEYAEPDSFGANGARLLLSLVAANLLHTGTAILDGRGHRAHEPGTLPPTRIALGRPLATPSSWRDRGHRGREESALEAIRPISRRSVSGSRLPAPPGPLHPVAASPRVGNRRETRTPSEVAQG